VVPNYVNSPTVQTITDYATTLTAKLNGSVVFQQSFSGPLSGSDGVTALTQADALLAAGGGTFGAPSLTSTVSTLESSAVAYIPTSPTLSLASPGACSEAEQATCSGVAYQSMVSEVTTFGPAKVNIGPGATDTFYVNAGQEDLNVVTTFTYTVDQNAVTTNTDLVSQSYEIDAIAGGSPAQAPEISTTSAASGLTLLFGALAALRGRRRRSIITDNTNPLPPSLSA